MTNKIKLQHNRPECIGCAACVAVAPDFWEMTEDGSKSDIKHGKNLDKGGQEVEVDEEHLQANKDAADCCPVNVIHIVDKQGKKIV